MVERRAGDSVDPRSARDGAEAVLVEETGHRQLARRRVPGVGPARTEPRGEHARRQSGGPHAHNHRLRQRAPCQIEQAQAVAEPPDMDSELDDFRPCGSHGGADASEIRRHAGVVVHRQHETPAAAAPDQIDESGPPLDVNVCGAQRDRLGEDGVTFLFASVELPSLPRRAAGDDERSGAAGERGRNVDVLHTVEPELDQVGAADGVAATAKFFRRGGRDRGAQKRFSSFGAFATSKKPLQPVWLKRL